VEKYDGMKDYLTKLNKDSNLFKKLINENPEWWQLLKAQKDCYIDVRKDNSINIYYRGASVFRICVSGGVLKFETAYSKKVFDGNNITLADLCNIKEAIRSNPKFKDGSESAIKASVVCGNREYIDSEFAHPAVGADGEPKVIRIDLVRLRSNTIEFVELKRFGDNRLLDKESYTAPTDKEEIVMQIGEYESFLREKHDKLIRYYSNLLEIKRDLGLFSGAIPANLTLSDKIVLLVDMTDYSDSDGQQARREALRELTAVAKIPTETTNGTPL
jgi:hypothetical protein